MKARKLQIKLFVKGEASIDTAPLVPVFHDWIKQDALSELLIDVVDYAHVHEGPSVLLVGHESDYCFDLREGKPGLVYSRKRGGAEEAKDLLVDALRRALRACGKLEAAEGLSRKLAFSRETLEIRLNDRRLTKNDAATFDEAKPVVEAALAEVYGDAAFTVKRRDNDPRELLTIDVSAPGAPGVGELSARLS